MEFADKTKGLTSFKYNMNTHCHRIMLTVDCAGMSDPNDPYPQFSPQKRPKPWVNMASGTMNEVDVLSILIPLESGGADTTHKKSIGGMELPLDQGVTMSLGRKLLEAHNSGQLITIDMLAEVLSNNKFLTLCLFNMKQKVFGGP